MWRDELRALCLDVNFVRNVRVSLVVHPDNEEQVLALLKSQQYCVTDRNVGRDGSIELRAV